MGVHETTRLLMPIATDCRLTTDAKPELGNVGQISIDDAFTRREALAAWRKNHPFSTSLDHFKCYEVLVAALA